MSTRSRAAPWFGRTLDEAYALVPDEHFEVWSPRDGFVSGEIGSSVEAMPHIYAALAGQALCDYWEEQDAMHPKKVTR